MAESECSTFWPFFHQKLAIQFLFHCLKCIFECIMDSIPRKAPGAFRLYRCNNSNLEFQQFLTGVWAKLIGKYDQKKTKT